MTHTFTILTGNMDSDKDKFVLSGMTFPRLPVVLMNHDVHKPIAVCSELNIIGNEIKATVKVCEGYNIKGLYPSIGYHVLKYSVDNGIRAIHEFKIYSIGIHAHLNADPKIKPIE